MHLSEPRGSLGEAAMAQPINVVRDLFLSCRIWPSSWLHVFINALRHIEVVLQGRHSLISPGFELVIVAALADRDAPAAFLDNPLQ